MSGLFSRLARRALGTAPTLTPRRPGVFEPDGGVAEVEELALGDGEVGAPVSTASSRPQPGTTVAELSADVPAAALAERHAAPTIPRGLGPAPIPIDGGTGSIGAGATAGGPGPKGEVASRSARRAELGDARPFDPTGAALPATPDASPDAASPRTTGAAAGSPVVHREAAPATRREEPGAALPPTSASSVPAAPTPAPPAGSAATQSTAARANWRRRASDLAVSPRSAEGGATPPTTAPFRPADRAEAVGGGVEVRDDARKTAGAPEAHGSAPVEVSIGRVEIRVGGSDRRAAPAPRHTAVPALRDLLDADRDGER